MNPHHTRSAPSNGWTGRVRLFGFQNYRGGGLPPAGPAGCTPWTAWTQQNHRGGGLPPPPCAPPAHRRPKPTPAHAVASFARRGQLPATAAALARTKLQQLYCELTAGGTARTQQNRRKPRQLR
eukprot:gene10976-biopygen15374